MNKTPPIDRNGKGHWAEQLAQDWLVSLGLSPHTQNYTRRLGEIDLVMRDEAQNTWVFVEVKYRSENALVSGIEAITKAKQRKLYRTAELFLQHIKDQTSPARIDVVVITQCTGRSGRIGRATSHQHDENEHPIKHKPDSPHPQTRIGNNDLVWIQNAVIG